MRKGQGAKHVSEISGRGAVEEMCSFTRFSSQSFLALVVGLIAIVARKDRYAEMT
jgi:hypothetical protein